MRPRSSRRRRASWLRLRRLALVALHEGSRPSMAPIPRISPRSGIFFGRTRSAPGAFSKGLALPSMASSSNTPDRQSPPRRPRGCRRRCAARPQGWTESMISAVPRRWRIGNARPHALATVIRSGSTPQCSMANIVPVRPMPLWISSATNRMPFPCRSSPAPGSSRARGDEPAFALDRLATTQATASGLTCCRKKSFSLSGRQHHRKACGRLLARKGQSRIC